MRGGRTGEVRRLGPLSEMGIESTFSFPQAGVLQALLALCTHWGVPVPGSVTIE